MNSTNDRPEPPKNLIGLQGTKFVLFVENMDRAVAFYRDVIGLSVASMSPYWSELTFGTAVIALHGGGDSSFKETGLSLTVAEIFSACTAIVDGGGSIRNHPVDRGEEGIYLAAIVDTENNGLMVSQEKVCEE